MSATRVVASLLSASLLFSTGSSKATVRAEPARSAAPASHYRPKLRVPEALEPFLAHVPPGSDAFADEREAAELGARLLELGSRLKQSPDGAASVAEWLLAPAFRGGRLLPDEERATTGAASFEVRRAAVLPQELALDSRRFAAELGRMVEDLLEVTVAEFSITAIEVKRDEGLASTEVRYDIVGRGRDAWRIQQAGAWRMKWRRDAATWRVVEWTATSHLQSRARAAVFTEVTAAALGAS